jgi:hypothetical protein
MKMKYITFLFVIGYMGTAEAAARPEILACRKINETTKGAKCNVYQDGGIYLVIDLQRSMSDLSSDDQLQIGTLRKMFMANNAGRMGGSFNYIEYSPESRRAGKAKLCQKRGVNFQEVCSPVDSKEIPQFTRSVLGVK